MELKASKDVSRTESFGTREGITGRGCCRGSSAKPHRRQNNDGCVNLSLSGSGLNTPGVIRGDHGPGFRLARAVWVLHPRFVTFPRDGQEHEAPGRAPHAVPAAQGTPNSVPAPGAGAQPPGRCGEGPSEAPAPLQSSPGALRGKPGERWSVERRLCPGRSAGCALPGIQFPD